MVGENDTYKLIYFNIRGIAEPIRYMFKLAGVEFTDERIEFPSEAWGKELKATYPWGTLPVLDVTDSNNKTIRIAQSATIGRFLAKRFNFCGSNDKEFSKCDEFVDALKDFHQQWVIWFRAKDEETKSAKMAELKETHIPLYFGQFNKILKEGGTGWLNGGNSFTWADLFVGQSLSFYADLSGERDQLLGKYSEVGKLIEKIFALPPVAKWIKERPETPF